MSGGPGLTLLSGLPYVPRVTSSLVVSLLGMRFHARVGILPHERELPQPLEIDVSVEVPESTLFDYRELHALVTRVVESGPLDYLEHVASGIADAVLERADVQTVRVAVRKPHVMLPGPLAGAQIELLRSRPERDARRDA